jgi:hypothetical protein
MGLMIYKILRGIGQRYYYLKANPGLSPGLAFKVIVKLMIREEVFGFVESFVGWWAIAHC